MGEWTVLLVILGIWFLLGLVVCYIVAINQGYLSLGETITYLFFAPIIVFISIIAWTVAKSEEIILWRRK
jgi:glycerol-3-phosphate acyltransferase PlsY